MGLNVYKVKASGLELKRLGSKLEEAGCTANHETPPPFRSLGGGCY